MLANKLFPLLARPDVQEIALLTGKPPSALVNDAYRRLSAQVLRDEDILSVLAAARGHEHLARLADGCRWSFDLPSVGTIAVSAAYDGTVLKAVLRLVSAHRATPASTPDQEEELDLVAEPALLEMAEPPPAMKPAAPARPSPPKAAAAGVQARVKPAARSERDPQDLEPAAAYGGGRLNVVSEPEMPSAGRERVADFELPAPREPAAFDEPIVAQQGGDLLDALFGRARALQASDLHVLADRPPKLRIAGELLDQGASISAQQCEQLILSRVPSRAQAQLAEQGSCDFSLVHPYHGRFRANVSRQRTGLKLTARPIGQNVPTLAELGLPESITRALQHHQGLIVITGPTGHGKTTTLAALVGILNRETTHHVITVEDPIEYVHDTARAVISQREVGTHTKSFQAALKGSLREDPDVIVVGELRDTETVRMALTASETGHLVISTMNTPSAAKAIERLIDLFPPGDQPQVRMTLAGGLRLIISQRLLPTADRRQLCAAAEVLPGSTPLWNLIRENRTFQITSLQQRGKSLGIIRLDDSLLELVQSQRTTLEIAREYAESPEQLENAVLGRNQPRVDPTAEPANDAAGNLQRRGVELGKQVFSRAGKLFGGETK
jgi:twitching motility protein PilT